MDLQIRILPTDLAGALRSHVERRLRMRLGRWVDRLRRVSVRIRDRAIGDGEVGKGCAISVQLAPSGKTIRRETVDPDMFAAIEYATERIASAVAREVDEARSRAGAG